MTGQKKISEIVMLWKEDKKQYVKNQAIRLMHF